MNLQTSSASPSQNWGRGWLKNISIPFEPSSLLLTLGLRRVLGLFVVSRRYIENYAVITKPLTDLLRGRHPTFEWGPSQQAAFEDTRDRLLAGIHLAAPDYELPFHLATDASEDGKGAVLYQLTSVPIEKQYPWSARVHHPQNMSVIQFLSKAWNEAQRNRPPFYLEADGLLWATDKCKFYALSSPLPFYTYSDHLPLQWMKTSTKVQAILPYRKSLSLPDEDDEVSSCG